MICSVKRQQSTQASDAWRSQPERMIGHLTKSTTSTIGSIRSTKVATNTSIKNTKVVDVMEIVAGPTEVKARTIQIAGTNIAKKIRSTKRSTSIRSEDQTRPDRVLGQDLGIVMSLLINLDSQVRKYQPSVNQKRLLHRLKPKLHL